MFNAHDLIADELMHDHSLGALDYLIDHGRELEFQYQDELFSMSKHGSPKYVTLSHHEKGQDFVSMDELFEKATLLSQPFLEVWKECKIITLF